MRLYNKVVIGLFIFCAALLSFTALTEVITYAYTNDDAINYAKEQQSNYSKVLLFKVNESSGTVYYFYGASGEMSVELNKPSAVSGYATTYIARTNPNTDLMTQSFAIPSNNYIWNVGEPQPSNLVINAESDTVSIIYANYDVHAFNSTTMTRLDTVIYNSSAQNWDGTYQMLYDKNIPNVEGMNLTPKSAFSLFGVNIGQSKDKYTLTWSKPEDLGLGFEISFQTKYKEITRRYLMQSWEKPYNHLYDNNGNVTKTIIISPQDAYMDISLMDIGRMVMKKMNDAGIDTGMYTSIPVTEMYFRYYIKNDTDHKIHYGNWCRIDMRAGAQGVQQVRYDDAITTTETVNPNTGETEYTDTPTDNNKTTYTDAQGDKLDESQSYEVIGETVDDAIGQASTGIKSVTEWLGQVPDLFAKLFSFLPVEIITLIGVSVLFAVVLRIAGR